MNPKFTLSRQPASVLAAALALGGALLLGGCRTPTTTDAAPDAVALYSYNDGAYAETVTLRPNGQYGQTENPAAPGIRGIARNTGAWRLLSKPGGAPIALPATAALLPPSAVVELKTALPYDVLYENRPQFGPKDRTIPAREFTLNKP
jgi:hypothetical protein